MRVKVDPGSVRLLAGLACAWLLFAPSGVEAGDPARADASRSAISHRLLRGLAPSPLTPACPRTPLGRRSPLAGTSISSGGSDPPVELLCPRAPRDDAAAI